MALVLQGMASIHATGLSVAWGLLVLAGGMSAHAASGTWLGGTSPDWNNSANWVGGNLPNGSSDVATFNGDRTFDNPELSGNISLLRLNISSGALATTISSTSSSLSISGGASTDAINVSNGTANVMDLDTSISFNNSAVTVSGTASSLTFASGRTLTLTSANASFWMRVAGGGTVNLNSDLNYVGLDGTGRGINVINGTLNFNPASITTSPGAMRLSVAGINTAGQQATLNLQRSLTASQVSFIVLGDNGATSVSTLRLAGDGLSVASSLTINGAGSGSGTRLTTFELDQSGTASGVFSGNLVANATGNSATVAFRAGQSDTLTFSGSLNTASTANYVLQKTGAGTVVFSGSAANVFGSAIAVNEGTLLLQKTAGTNAVNTDLTVNATAELRLGAANQIANTASLNLAGGSFNAAGFNETLGALVINGINSGIDFGAGTSIVNFASGSYTSGTLTIFGWTNGVDSWRFASDPTAFVNAMGSNLVFNGFGSGGTVVDLGGGTWEIVAVPEPSANALLMAGLSGAFLLAVRRRRA